MENVENQFEVKAVDDVELVDESTLKGTVGGALFSPAKVLATRSVLSTISPVRLRPIDLVMGKTTLL